MALFFATCCGRRNSSAFHFSARKTVLGGFECQEWYDNGVTVVDPLCACAERRRYAGKSALSMTDRKTTPNAKMSRKRTGPITDANKNVRFKFSRPNRSISPGDTRFLLLHRTSFKLHVFRISLGPTFLFTPQLIIGTLLLPEKIGRETRRQSAARILSYEVIRGQRQTSPISENGDRVRSSYAQR